MKKNTMLESVKACRLFQKGYQGPAQSVRLVDLVNASMFERGQIAAMSIKYQRAELAKARKYIDKGQPDAAQMYILSYKLERKNYNQLFTFGAK